MLYYYNGMAEELDEGILGSQGRFYFYFYDRRSLVPTSPAALSLGLLVIGVAGVSPLRASAERPTPTHATSSAIGCHALRL